MYFSISYGTVVPFVRGEKYESVYVAVFPSFFKNKMIEKVVDRNISQQYCLVSFIDRESGFYEFNFFFNHEFY